MPDSRQGVYMWALCTFLLFLMQWHGLPRFLLILRVNLCAHMHCQPTVVVRLCIVNQLGSCCVAVLRALQTYSALFSGEGEVGEGGQRVQQGEAVGDAPPVRRRRRLASPPQGLVPAEEVELQGPGVAAPAAAERWRQRGGRGKGRSRGRGRQRDAARGHRGGGESSPSNSSEGLPGAGSRGGGRAGRGRGDPETQSLSMQERVMVLAAVLQRGAARNALQRMSHMADAESPRPSSGSDDYMPSDDEPRGRGRRRGAARGGAVGRRQSGHATRACSSGAEGGEEGGEGVDLTLSDAEQGGLKRRGAAAGARGRAVHQAGGRWRGSPSPSSSSSAPESDASRGSRGGETSSGVLENELEEEGGDGVLGGRGKRGRGWRRTARGNGRARAGARAEDEVGEADEVGKRGQCTIESSAGKHTAPYLIG